MTTEEYKAQVQLLVRTLPLVAEENCFALKGGTAINLFIRNLPRFSVDIDLAYVPVADRAVSLAAIEAALRRIHDRIRATLPYTFAEYMRTRDGDLTGLQVRNNEAQIKIEVTPVMRGTVYAVENRAVMPKVEEAFGFAEIQVVSFADLYGGKMVAALDRQHPRDFFDVRDLLRNEGIDDALRAAFLVYIITSPEPILSLVTRHERDMEADFNAAFVGMTDERVTLDDLKQARIDLYAAIIDAMPDAHRRLLVGIQAGAPDWTALNLPGVPELPAVQRRLQKVGELPPEKRAQFAAELAAALGVAS